MQYECYSEDTAKGFQYEIGNSMMTKIFIKHNFSAPNFHGNIVTCDDLTRMNFKCPWKLHANSGFSFSVSRSKSHWKSLGGKNKQEHLLKSIKLQNLRNFEHQSNYIRSKLKTHHTSAISIYDSCLEYCNLPCSCITVHVQWVQITNGLRFGK